MQKVIIVNLISRPDEREMLTERQLPEVNKLLDEGYQVVQFYQIAPSSGTSVALTLTFVLEKPTKKTLRMS